ncbi:uncharacterized protein LOC135839758 isoform X2 [Planococcus citri]
MQILELGRPFTGGSWCGKSSSLALYYSESSTITLTIRLFYTGRYSATPFEFKLRYKFIKKEEAVTRFGSISAPIERGEIVPGTYCSRNFYECYRKKCQIQSPNYPGIYPRNVTCLYQIRQKTVPKCKHGMILVRQTNRHKIKLKRSVEDVKNTTETGLKVWDTCDDTKDHLIFYDGLTTEDAVLLKYCGGEWLPPVLSRGPQMLVIFRSAPFNIPLQSKETSSLIKGFELDMDTVFTDSDSYDFSRHRFRCDFLINATESEMENGVAIKSKNRSGSISSPRHTLPPNTTCTYRFQGRAADHVWLSIASYWHEPLLSGQRENCPTRLRIWDGGGGGGGSSMLGDHCSRPKICDHSALRNHSRITRPCTAEESYISSTNSIIMQYYSKPGTAIHPSKFLIHYEFVDTALGGRPWLNLEKEDRSRFRSCSRLFKGAQSGTISSPKNVFMYARGGAKSIACLYRIEAEPGEKISFTLYNVSFGSNANCQNTLHSYTDQYVCTHNDQRVSRQSELEISELPWKDVKIQRSCFCDNSTVSKIPSGVYTLETVARVLEIRFKVYYVNSSEDFFDIYFHAKFRMFRKPDCPRRQRLRGSGGEIQMVHPPQKRIDSFCDGLPWMVEARENRSLFILTWGHFLSLKPVPEEPIRCNTRNRILLYSGTPLRLFHVVCPSIPNDNRQEIHIFSEEWHSSTRADKDKGISQNPPSFLLRFIGKESGTALLNWLEISRSRTSLLLQSDTASSNLSHSAASLENQTALSAFDCPFHCPELNACISDNLWCDGHRNCPSGYDELESHCDLKYKALRNYAILTSILVLIFMLTIFVLVATIRRFRFSNKYAHEDMGPRRITTEETLYDQSSSTMSS